MKKVYNNGPRQNLQYGGMSMGTTLGTTMGKKRQMDVTPMRTKMGGGQMAGMTGMMYGGKPNKRSR
tara:strand:+ start:127 stop:324 length:198 start_codon:yes stop_codon:yes gene_type:complete